MYEYDDIIKFLEFDSIDVNKFVNIYNIFIKDIKDSLNKYSIFLNYAHKFNSKLFIKKLIYHFSNKCEIIYRTLIMKELNDILNNLKDQSLVYDFSNVNISDEIEIIINEAIIETFMRRGHKYIKYKLNPKGKQLKSYMIHRDNMKKCLNEFFLKPYLNKDCTNIIMKFV